MELRSFGAVPPPNCPLAPEEGNNCHTVAAGAIYKDQQLVGVKTTQCYRFIIVRPRCIKRRRRIIEHLGKAYLGRLH